MNQLLVAILTRSDLSVIETAFNILKKFDIPYKVKVSSAHRTPKTTHEYVVDVPINASLNGLDASEAHWVGALYWLKNAFTSNFGNETTTP